MRLVTSLQLPCTFFKHWTPEDREATVVIIKAGFDIQPDGRLTLAQAQAPIAELDTFRGEPNASSLLREQELAPAKPATDLTLNAVARSPQGRPLPDWPVGIQVVERASYQFYVRGPWAWRKRLGRWRAGEPEPVAEVPLHYELAYGGHAPGADGEAPEYYDYNPVGRGFINRRRLESNEPIPGPQIGDLAEFMAARIDTPMSVHGVGPLAKAWLPRRAEAGTFDDAWLATRHPRMPKDYRLGYWNAAPKRLQLSPHLRGDEHILLIGLRHDPAPHRILLPRAGLAAHIDRPEAPAQPMPLTDVLIDIAAADPLQHRVELIWRLMLDDPGDIDTLHVEPFRVRPDNQQSAP